MAIKLNGILRNSTVAEQSQDIIGAWHMANNPEIFEPQRVNNFMLLVHGLDNIVRPGMTAGETAGTIPGAEQALTLSVTKAFIPHFTQDPIAVQVGNTTINFAGVPKFGSGTVTVNDWIGTNSKEILMAWQALSGNLTTQKVGLASDYKKEATLIEYTPDWQRVRSWNLHGCWVSGLSEDDYDNEGSGKKTITATIVYDYGEIDQTETGQGATTVTV